MESGSVKFIIAIIVGFFILRTCNSSDKSQESQTSSSSWQKSPVDKLIVALSDENNYSIILQDMDSENGAYKHQYRIVVEHPDTVLTKETQWESVTDQFFSKNIENLGMEIAARKDGKLSKVASPAGFNHYVGNEKYGRWQESNGSSFWSFYGRYAFMSSMFNMMAYPARRSYYNDYSRGYYGSKPYYGPSGNTYGTRQYTSSTKGKSSKWGAKPSTFRSSVRSQVTKSAAASSAAAASRAASAKRARSSSRYSSSSSRSRSGGFGK